MCNNCECRFEPRYTKSSPPVGEPKDYIIEEKKDGVFRKIVKVLEASLSLVIAVIIPAAIIISGYIIFDLPFKG